MKASLAAYWKVVQKRLTDEICTPVYNRGSSSSRDYGESVLKCRRSTVPHE